MTFHFEPCESHWTDDDVREFSELMILGGVDLGKHFDQKPRRKKRELSTLAQSKVRTIGERSYQPIDRVALLVARKLTCRICGKLDFSNKTSRSAHEFACKKAKAETDRIERNKRANRKLEIRWGLAEGELGDT